jgi:acyl transferase domain-containing protein
MAKAAEGRPQAVAIVGMACLFPKAPDVVTYWENIVAKVDAIGDPPDSRDMEAFIHNREETGLYCVRGGYIGDLARFHPQRFGVMPHAVDGAEPDQFIALEVAHQTLCDAGVPDVPLNRERTEVILGRGTFVNRGTLTQFQHKIAVDQFVSLLRELHPEHDEREIEAIRGRLKATLPPITPEVAGGMAPSLVSGRIANRFDLKGLNCTLDAACASSLIAIEQGMQDLLAGRCDAVLAGGVQVSTPAPIHNMFADMGALSRGKHLRPFDEDADGTMLGEGAGMVLLKRLEDAERDGNRIYALIRAVGSSSDGRAKAVLTPRVEGEELALRRAYEEAEISPDTIELIEAHGTAMPVGDQTEVEALRRVFGERRNMPAIALGSVKSMISHLLPAAGVAGIIKTALALHQKILPPTIHCEKPNPKLEIEKTPFYLNTEARPWIHGTDAPRRAGVNAFGFGGINAHAILEEHHAEGEPGTPSFLRTWDSELLILAAEDREGLLARATTLRRACAAAPRTPLRDLAWSVNADGAQGALRLAIVASDVEDLARKLDHATGRLGDPACSRIKDRKGIFFFAKPLYPEGEIAFLFPGEGSQYPYMLADLCHHFPSVRSRFDLMDRAFLDHPRGYRPSHFIFPPSAPGHASDPEEAERRLWQMDGAVESVFVASQALSVLLGELGLRPLSAACTDPGRSQGFPRHGGRRRSGAGGHDHPRERRRVASRRGQLPLPGGPGRTSRSGGERGGPAAGRGRNLQHPPLRSPLPHAALRAGLRPAQGMLPSRRSAPAGDHPLVLRHGRALPRGSGGGGTGGPRTVDPAGPLPRDDQRNVRGGGPHLRGGRSPRQPHGLRERHSRETARSRRSLQRHLPEWYHPAPSPAGPPGGPGGPARSLAPLPAA